jgi:coenzyme F420-0:L-glutamate ligase / coenzyme F420-1:gamma-L-glutamate ligase
MALDHKSRKDIRLHSPLHSPEIRISAVPGLPEITPGADLVGLVARAIRAKGLRVGASDVFVVAQKIVSKAEGRIVDLSSVVPSERATQWATQYGKDPRMIELVLREARRIVRMERGVLIVETQHGLVCANAGVDASNTPHDAATLLPVDPDRSARELATGWSAEFGVPVGVIVSDTFGRPWRDGLANVAIGVAGLSPLADYRGKPDSSDRPMQATIIAVADELASAAELVMGKTAGVPVAIVQGFTSEGIEGSASQMIRPADQDLFR